MPCSQICHLQCHQITELLNFTTTIEIPYQYLENPNWQTLTNPDQSVTNIFQYSNIFVTDIYLSFVSIFWYKYIRTFVRVKFDCTNVFGYSIVSVIECKNCLNIWIYSNIHTIFNANVYSDIRLCQIFYTNIFGYSFV